MTEREKLIELLTAGGKLAIEKNHKYIQEFVKIHGRYNSKTDNNVPFEEIVADYLLENGVSVPSCKVGDMVYQVDSAGDIYESEVTHVVYDTKGIAFGEAAIGKSVFLTREEAEKACGLRGTKYEVP